MIFDKYKNIKISKDFEIKKEVLIGGATLAAVTTIALVCHKTSSKKKKEEIQKHRDEDLANLIEEIEMISAKIVELSQTQEQIDTLIKEKVTLKNSFILKPY